MNAECTNCAKLHNFKMPSVLVIPEGQSAESIAALLIDVIEKKAEEVKFESDRVCLLRAKEILLASVGEKRPKYRRTVCGQFPAFAKGTIPIPETRDAVPAIKMPSPPKDCNLLYSDVDESSKTQHEQGKHMLSCSPESGAPVTVALEAEDKLNDADVSLHSYGLSILEAAGLGLHKADSQERLQKHPHTAVSLTVCDKKRTNESTEREFLVTKRSRSEAESSESTICDWSKRDETSSYDTEQTRQSPVDSNTQKGESPCCESDSKNLNFHGYPLLKSKKDMPRDIPLERTTCDLASDPRLKTVMLKKVKRLATVARSLVMAKVFHKLGLVTPLLSRNITANESSLPGSSGISGETPSAAELLAPDSGDLPTAEVATEYTPIPPPILESEKLPAGREEETVAIGTNAEGEEMISANTKLDKTNKQYSSVNECCSATATNMETSITVEQGLEPVESDGTLISSHKDHIGVLPMNLDHASDDDSNPVLNWNSSAHSQPVMTVPCYPNLIVSNERPVWGYAQWQQPQTWNNCSIVSTEEYQLPYNFYPTCLPPQPWLNMRVNTMNSEVYRSWQSHSNK